MTNGQILAMRAEVAGIPLVSIWHAQEGLARDHKRDPKIAKTMARLMLRHGRLTDEARAWVAREYPQG